MLVTCPECSNKVSEEAELCPQCGLPHPGINRQEIAKRQAQALEALYLIEKEAFETAKKSYIESYRAKIGIYDQLKIKKPSLYMVLSTGDESIIFMSAIVGFLIGLFFFKSRWLWFLGYAGFIWSILAGLLSWRLSHKQFKQHKKDYDRQKEDKQYCENKLMELNTIEYSHENYQNLNNPGCWR